MTTPSPLTPHPHAAVIKAWADGHPVEWRRKGGAGLWQTLVGDGSGFFSYNEYRVKPTEPAAAPLDDLRRLLLEAEILQLRCTAANAREEAFKITGPSRLQRLHDISYFKRVAEQTDDLADKLEAFL